MEIDPEVAELLGDLPPARLPRECVEAEWGTNSMRRVIAWGQQPPKPPSEGPQAPTYDETCVQCGRPITRHRDRWEDHLARTVCDHALLNDGDFAGSYHLNRSEYDLLARMAPKAPFMPLPATKAKKFKDLKANTKEVNCSKTKHSNSCAHTCSQPSAHFGFHECRYCRHIWGP